MDNIQKEFYLSIWYCSFWVTIGKVKASQIFNQISFHCVSYYLSTVLILPSLRTIHLQVYFLTNDRTTACIKNQ